MESIINEYCAYTEYAAKIGDEAYAYGSAVAQKAIADGKNPYEVMGIVVDNIMSAFAVQRIKYGTQVRKENAAREETK